MDFFSKEVLWIISVLLTLIGYAVYFRDMYKWITKPHIFSWLVWWLLTWIAYFASFSDGWGSGSWVLGISSLACLIIAALGTRNGYAYITKSDKIALFASLFSLLLRYLTEDPLLSVILISLVDAWSFLPTFRKGRIYPHEETASSYFYAGLKFVIAMFALGNYSLITVLYPASLILMNWAFLLLLFYRRRKI